MTKQFAHGHFEVIHKSCEHKMVCEGRGSEKYPKTVHVVYGLRELMKIKER